MICLRSLRDLFKEEDLEHGHHVNLTL
ncbi:hypothetical protein MQA_02266, partial [Staphylococcus aureus subsp. aureus VRS1]